MATNNTTACVTENEVAAALPPEGSFFTEFIKYAAFCTDAPVAYHIGGALSILAMTAPIDLSCLFGTPMYSNVYSILVGPSAARKSAAIGVARKLLEKALPTSLGTVPGSKENLVDTLAKNPRQLIVYSEFGSFLAQAERGYMNPLKTAFTEAWDCLSSDTEVLTPSGWKRYGEVPVGSAVYALNRETERLEVVRVDAVGERAVRPDERMLSIKGLRADIRTTEGHDYYVKYRDMRKRGALSDTWLCLKGHELAERRSAYALPTAAPLDRGFPGVELSDDELRFVAWFMTDGGFSDVDVCISQSEKSPYTSEIRALLTRLGFDFTERVYPPGAGAYPNATPCVRFLVPKGTHTGKLARNGWNRLASWLDKKVSPKLHAMTERQFQIFWTEALKGDGEKATGYLWCKKAQADAYAHMAVVRGFSVTIGSRLLPSGLTMYRMKVRKAGYLTSDLADPRAAKPTLVAPNPGEKVWCVTNRLGTLVTRRNGKVVILGNCSALGRGLVKSSTEAKNPRLSLLAGVTPDFLARHTEPADWTGGFMARFFCLMADREREFTVPPGWSGKEPELVARVQHLEAAGQFGVPRGECHPAVFDYEARQRWDAWYRHLGDYQQRSTEETSAAIARSHTHALRIALLLAWDYGGARSGYQWCITLRELEPAIRLTELHLRSVLRLGQSLDSTKDMRDRRVVLKTFPVKVDPATGVVHPVPISLADIIKNSRVGMLRRVREILETLVEEGTVRIHTGLDVSGAWYCLTTPEEQAQHGRPKGVAFVPGVELGQPAVSPPESSGAKIIPIAPYLEPQPAFYSSFDSGVGMDSGVSNTTPNGVEFTGAVPGGITFD